MAYAPGLRNVTEALKFAAVVAESCRHSRPVMRGLRLRATWSSTDPPGADSGRLAQGLFRDLVGRGS